MTKAWKSRGRTWTPESLIEIYNRRDNPRIYRLLFWYHCIIPAPGPDLSIKEQFARNFIFGLWPPREALQRSPFEFEEEEICAQL